MVNQAFMIIIAYRPRRRRKIPGIGRYPMGPTMTKTRVQVKGANLAYLLGPSFAWAILKKWAWWRGFSLHRQN